MTWQRNCQIALELAICAVHPVPGKYTFLWTTKMANQGGIVKTEVSFSTYCVKVIVCIDCSRFSNVTIFPRKCQWT